MVFNINKLVLSGTIYTSPIRRTVSPAGVPHCTFVLEHRSQQLEAGLIRQVWCRITTIASGQKLQNFTNNIMVGSKIKVMGFISNHHSSNGINNLVFHAEQIKLINVGE